MLAIILESFAEFVCFHIHIKKLYSNQRMFIFYIVSEINVFKMVVIQPADKQLHFATFLCSMWLLIFDTVIWGIFPIANRVVKPSCNQMCWYFTLFHAFDVDYPLFRKFGNTLIELKYWLYHDVGAHANELPTTGTHAGTEEKKNNHTCS